MPVDVESELARLGTAWSESVAHVDVAEVLERSMTTRSQPIDDVGDPPATSHHLMRAEPRSRRSGERWLVAAACAALVITGVVALAQRRDGGPQPAPTNSATTPSVPIDSVAPLPPPEPFVGVWVSTDGDGSSQTMEIVRSGADEYEVVIRDEAAIAACAGAPATMTGTALLETDARLVIAQPELTCDDGTTPSMGPPPQAELADFAFDREPVADELTDRFGVVWQRAGSNDEPIAPSPVTVVWSRPVTDDEPAPAPVQPESAASAPGGWVAFSGSDDIYVVRGGVQPRRVDVPGSDTRTEACPAFAPDGTRLLFGRASTQKIWISTESGGDWEDAYVDGELVIVTVGDDGSTSEPETIPLDGMDAMPCPIWAPDGRWVAFGGAGTVWVVDTESRETRRLPDYYPTDLEWRPGSDELTITGNLQRGLPGSDAPIDLYSVSAGTTRTLQEVEAAYFSWSPDGTTLAFRHGKEVADAGVWLVDSDGQNLRRLPEDGDRAIHGVDVVWSPNGDQIAFQRTRPESSPEASEVVLVTATDADPTNPIGTQRVIAAPVTASGEWFPFSVTWSPDGSHLLYVGWQGDDEGVIAVPIEGDEPPVVLAVGSGDVRAHLGAPSIPLQQWQPIATSQPN